MSRQAHLQKPTITPLPPKYLSTAEVLQHVGISRATLHRWRTQGLPCYRPGGRGNPRFLLAEVEAFIQASARQSTSPINLKDITG